MCDIYVYHKIFTRTGSKSPPTPTATGCGSLTCFSVLLLKKTKQNSKTRKPQLSANQEPILRTGSLATDPPSPPSVSSLEESRMQQSQCVIPDTHRGFTCCVWVCEVWVLRALPCSPPHPPPSPPADTSTARCPFFTSTGFLFPRHSTNNFFFFFILFQSTNK